MYRNLFKTLFLLFVSLFWVTSCGNKKVKTKKTPRAVTGNPNPANKQALLKKEKDPLKLGHMKCPIVDFFDQVLDR